jgi:hypothetical protein
MINIAKKAVGILLPLAALSMMVHGQNVPAVTAPAAYQGFSLPDVPGTLRYSLTATQGLRTGYYLNTGNVYTTGVSADLGYLSQSTARPFSATYSGGYVHNTSGQPALFFQNLALSQTFTTEYWTFVLSNSLNYLPEAAAGGLSGIPGVGDLGVATPPSPDPGQDILSRYGQRVGNTTTGSVERKLTGSTSIQGSGTYFLQRFLSASGGLDIDQESVQVNLNHRIDALNNTGGAYTFSRLTYPSAPDFSFITQGINVQYTRQWTRQITTDVSLGPQRSTTAPITVGTVVRPGSSVINVSTNASLNYSGERTSYGISYFRGVRGGSGVVPGSISDDVLLHADRRVGGYAHLSVEGAYNHSETLQILTPNQTSIQTIVGNVQASRVITDNLSGYISYGLQKQIIQGAALTFNGFGGLSQTASIGITYSPKPRHLGHQ